MTKREKLTKELNEKLCLFEQANAALVCDCICHNPGVNILHFMGCCIGGGTDIPKLKAEIIKLKEKLRIKESDPWLTQPCTEEELLLLEKADSEEGEEW